MPLASCAAPSFQLARHFLSSHFESRGSWVCVGGFLCNNPRKPQTKQKQHPPERFFGGESDNNKRKKQLLRLQSKFFSSLLGTHRQITHFPPNWRGGSPLPPPANHPPQAPERPPRFAKVPINRLEQPSDPSRGGLRSLKGGTIFSQSARLDFTLPREKLCHGCQC